MPARIARRIVIAAAAAAGLGLSIPVARRIDGTRSAPAAGDPLIGGPVPSLAGAGPDGSAADLADLRGKVILVNAWASWCAPCREEMPLLLEAQRRWHGDGVRLFGLNSADSSRAAREFLTEVGAHGMPTVFDPDGAIAAAWGIGTLPQTLLVDRDGIVRDRRAGKVSSNWLRATVVPRL